MNNSFVHLHAHTEYSMLDGAAKITDYLKKVKELNQPAAAITDHGNLYGALEFVRQAESLDIKPIIGYEAYVTPGSRFDRPDRDNNKRYHLTLLAENNVGYQNLVELVSKAYLEGFYYKPRVDYQLLSEHSEGIIALSGCLGGEVAQHLAPDGSKEEGIIPPVISFLSSSSVYPTANLAATLAMGNPVAFEANADDLETLGFISITSISPFSGLTVN